MEYVPLWIFVVTVIGVVLTGLIAFGGLLAYILRSHLNPMKELDKERKRDIETNEKDIKNLNGTILSEIQTISKDTNSFTLQYTRDMSELREYIHLNFPGRQELTDKLDSLEKSVTDKTKAVHARMQNIEDLFHNTKH